MADEPFSPKPQTQADFVRETYRLITEEVIPRQDKTNGRVMLHDRILLVLAGALMAWGAINVGPLVSLVFAAVTR